MSALVRLAGRTLAGWSARVRVGADPRRCEAGTIVFFPRGAFVLRCGIAAIVEVARGGASAGPVEALALSQVLAQAVADVAAVEGASLAAARADGAISESLRASYAGGDERLDRLAAWARSLKRGAAFPQLATDGAWRASVVELAARLRGFADLEDARLQLAAADLADAEVEVFSARLLRVRDIAWQVEREAVPQADEAIALCGEDAPTPKLVADLRNVTAVLRCIDRIEIRGRDSAGLAVQVSFKDAGGLASFRRRSDGLGIASDLERRTLLPDLAAMSVAVSAGTTPCVTFVYKVAAEVGRLGDNVAELRRQIRGDTALRAALSVDGSLAVVLGHTRWASSGVISVPNCHPVDNGTHRDAGGASAASVRTGRIFVVMNGDVDNHIDLRDRYERESSLAVSPRITTDTKVVALEIDRQVAAGHGIEDAFRLAVQSFHGSCAIGMVTDLAPGRVFLSLRGSGQSLYIGASDAGFMASSEVYGVVEETPKYLKLDGEKDRIAGDPSTRGQIVVISADGALGESGLVRRGFDGPALAVEAKEIRTAEITTRDVDRGDFDHFFRKEITQSTRSVTRTLWGRVITGADGLRRVSPRILSDRVRAHVASGKVKEILVVGQGTAAVAGMGISEFFRRAAAGTPIRIHALPATELSGFHLRDDLSHTLVIAVTQSGSTADTNRAVDLARRRGAVVIAIVNRRNSDITYRADGVVYTSDGRDVEMSVASTKAFYSQLTAGALVSLALADAFGVITASDLDREVAALENLPALMQRMFDVEDTIRRAAAELAPTRQHWAVVASGPNQVAGEEVRIKLSELCYKSIAVDTVENKKHIDLSSEPLVIVLAAGNPESVLNDVVKDVAIFKAHKAVPIVFAPEGDRRFDPYAAAVISVPAAPPLASMVLCALGGHLFGYHAARAIDENARFLSGVRAQVVEAIGDDRARGELPTTLAPSRREFLDRLQQDRFTSSMHPVTAVRLSSLLDLATGVAVDTPETLAFAGALDGDVLAGLVNVLGRALDECARPVDAIKHQAKIVTVGTSRPEEAMRGLVADALAVAGVDQDALAPVDLLEIRRIQPAVREVAGLTRYVVAGLRADGSPGHETTLRVVDRRGVAASMKSRAEQGAPLAGTKRQVVSDRRLFLGVGRGDGHRIAILPMLGADRMVSGLVLLHLAFLPDLSRAAKSELLGAKLDRLRDLVTETNRTFDLAMLDRLTPEQIVVEDASDLAERIVA